MSFKHLQLSFVFLFFFCLLLTFLLMVYQIFQRIDSFLPLFGSSTFLNSLIITANINYQSSLDSLLPVFPSRTLFSNLSKICITVLCTLTTSCPKKQWQNETGKERTISVRSSCLQAWVAHSIPLIRFKVSLTISNPSLLALPLGKYSFMNLSTAT